MSKTYTAWNGSEYSWPPPENWYIASDGRWWHPDSSPSSPEGAVEPPLTTVEPATEASNGAEPSQPSTNGAPSTPESSSGDDDADPVDIVVPVAEPEPARSGFRPSPRMVIAVVCVGLAALGMFSYTRLAGSDGERTASSEADSDDDEVAGASITEPPGDNPGNDDTDNENIDELDAGSAGAGAEMVGTAGGETSTSASTVAADPETVAEFRQLLSEHGLSASGLSDEEVTTFATAFCVLAAGSADSEDFDQHRELAISTTESELPEDVLNTAMSAAVIVYCPDEAERLDIAI